MRLIQEERGLTAATHVYEPDSYVPLARIDLGPDLSAKARTPDKPALAARAASMGRARGHRETRYLNLRA